jgi:hypothetical protein
MVVLAGRRNIARTGKNGGMATAGTAQQAQAEGHAGHHWAWRDRASHVRAS